MSSRKVALSVVILLLASVCVAQEVSVVQPHPKAFTLGQTFVGAWITSSVKITDADGVYNVYAIPSTFEVSVEYGRLNVRWGAATPGIVTVPIVVDSIDKSGVYHHDVLYGVGLVFPRL